MAEPSPIPAQQARAGRPRHHDTLRKRLDDDCLLDRELHPNIAERLHRVRELPVSSVANFRGVEVDEDGVWLVWQYIDGVTLEEHLSTARSHAHLHDLARELRLAVAALHAHGIVHGAIHARNVIIDPQGKLYLTHIIPLLFSDPVEDDRTVSELLDRFEMQPDSVANATASPDRADRRIRLGAYVAAAVAILVAMLIFAAILWYIQR